MDFCSKTVLFILSFTSQLSTADQFEVQIVNDAAAHMATFEWLHIFWPINYEQTHHIKADLPGSI